MNDNNPILKTLSSRLFVRKEKIIDESIFIETNIDKSRISFNQNCCGKIEKQIQNHNLDKLRENLIYKPDEFIVEVPQQKKSLEILSNKNQPLFYKILKNAWPLSCERVENLIISNKRCQFSNEAISIKPITAVPGIGKKYGQLLADHGFIYARQLLGYYMMLKDRELFRKWLEYRFNIPRFRAAETASALDEALRRIL